MTTAAKRDVARGRPYFEHRAAPVQIALGSHRLGTIVLTFGHDLDFRELGLNAVSIGHLDGGANAQLHIRGHINHNVAGRSLQNRIVALSASSDEPGLNAASPG